jgi:hypothetical protein
MVQQLMQRLNIFCVMLLLKINVQAWDEDECLKFLTAITVGH